MDITEKKTQSLRVCRKEKDLYLKGNRISGDQTLLLALSGICAFNDEFVFLSEFGVVFSHDVSEAPFSRDSDLLTAWELEFGASKAFNNMRDISFFGADREQHLADLHTGDSTAGFAEGTSHPRLKSVGSGAGQHLVDAKHMPRMNPNTHVERIFPGYLGNVLVGTDTGCF